MKVKKITIKKFAIFQMIEYNINRKKYYKDRRKKI